MTDKQPTEAQLKELWEWCGLKQKCSPQNDMFHRGIWTDAIEWRQFDTPEIDLNNLFKYAVPKLKQEYRNWKNVLRIWIDSSVGDCEKDALALFWAIWSLIEKGKATL